VIRSDVVIVVVVVAAVIGVVVEELVRKVVLTTAGVEPGEKVRKTKHERNCSGDSLHFP